MPKATQGARRVGWAGWKARVSNQRGCRAKKVPLMGGSHKQAAKSHPNRTYYFRKPEAEDLNKLVQLSTRQLKARPDNLKALHIRAMSRMKLGEFEAATQDYTAMLQYGGDDVVTLYNRGCALEKNGRYDEAIADFTKVLQLDPAFAAGAAAHPKTSELPGRKPAFPCLPKEGEKL